MLKVDWSKFIAVNGATAHPHVDPDGTVFNMGNSYGRKGEILTHIFVYLIDMSQVITEHYVFNRSVIQHYQGASKD